MEVPDEIKDAAKEVTSAASKALKKKGGLGGALRWLGRLFGEIAPEVGTGMVTGYLVSKGAAHQVEVLKAQEKADQLRAEGKEKEASSLMNAFLAAWTMEDETDEFQAFPRAVNHFNKKGENDKADAMLRTFASLDADGLNRLGVILLNCRTEDARADYLVNWGNASPEQQKNMLRITRIHVTPEDHSSHVLSSRMRSTAMEQRDNSNRHVNQLVEHYHREAELREQMRQLIRNRAPQADKDALLQQWRAHKAARP